MKRHTTKAYTACRVPFNSNRFDAEELVGEMPFFQDGDKCTSNIYRSIFPSTDSGRYVSAKNCAETARFHDEGQDSVSPDKRRPCYRDLQCWYSFCLPIVVARFVYLSHNHAPTRHYNPGTSTDLRRSRERTSLWESPWFPPFALQAVCPSPPLRHTPRVIAGNKKGAKERTRSCSLNPCLCFAQFSHYFEQRRHARTALGTS